MSSFNFHQYVVLAISFLHVVFGLFYLLVYSLFCHAISLGFFERPKKEDVNRNKEN